MHGRTNAFITSRGPVGRDYAQGKAAGKVTARGPPGRDKRMFYHGILNPSQNLDVFFFKKTIKIRQKLAEKMLLLLLVWII